MANAARFLNAQIPRTSGQPQLKTPTLEGHSEPNFRYTHSGSTTRIHDLKTGEELIRHADLWFKDGSVICQADRTLFRVHISQLSRHSVLFADIFTLPQPRRSSASYYSDPDGSDMPDMDSATRTLIHECENCPVVILQDRTEDVANFLVALYDGPDFGNNNREDFDVVCGILRLSTKYIVDALRAKAIAHLSIGWPSTLKGWDAREDAARMFEMETATSSGQFYPSPIAVINLAREVDCPSLLPAAFYDLSRHSYAQIFEAADDDPFFQSPSLAVSDMQRLALGKEAAQHNVTALIQSMSHAQTYIRHSQMQTHFRKSSSGGVCISAAACRKDFSELVDLATQHYLFDRERGHCDPLYVSEELGQLKSAEFSECKACARSLELWAAREREKLWKMIPLWFRLEQPTA